MYMDANLTDLTLRHGPSTVLRGITFTFRAGTYYSISGRSGSGKSTLLNVLGLLIRPSSGSYRVGETDTAQMTDAQRSAFRAVSVGRIFQDFKLLGHRSVYDNISLQKSRYQTEPLDSETLHEALSTVGLAGFESRRASTLSGGEQQRVGLARLLVQQPNIVLADEPTGNLDSDNATAVMQCLEQLVNLGKTLIVVTHDPDMAKRASFRLRMSDGLLDHESSSLWDV